jgi:hypothetical protein
MGADVAFTGYTVAPFLRSMEYNTPQQPCCY